MSPGFHLKIMVHRETVGETKYFFTTSCVDLRRCAVGFSVPVARYTTIGRREEVQGDDGRC